MKSTMTNVCLVLAIVLSGAVSTQGNGGLLTKIKQLKPRVETVVKRAAVGVACLAAICTLQFSSPADARLLELSSRMELLRQRNVFTHLDSIDAVEGTRTAKWLGGGGDVEQDVFISTFVEAGLTFQKHDRFNFFLNGRLKNQKDPFGDASVKPEIRTGMDFIMGYDSWAGEGAGYVNAEFLLAEGYPETSWVGAYPPDEKGLGLGDYNLKPLSLRLYFFTAAKPRIAMVGVEYFDGDNDKLLGAEDLNGYVFSLFRFGVSGESNLPGDRGVVEKALNMTYGISILDHEELEHIFSNDYLTGLFARLGGHLDYILYYGKLNVGFAGENKTATVSDHGGAIEGIVMENSFNMTVEVNILPYPHHIRLEGSLDLVQQMLISTRGTGLLHEEDRGGTITFFLKKAFY